MLCLILADAAPRTITTSAAITTASTLTTPSTIAAAIITAPIASNAAITLAAAITTAVGASNSTSTGAILTTTAACVASAITSPADDACWDPVGTGVRTEEQCVQWVTEVYVYDNGHYSGQYLNMGPHECNRAACRDCALGRLKVVGGDCMLAAHNVCLNCCQGKD